MSKSTVIAMSLFLCCMMARGQSMTRYFLTPTVAQQPGIEQHILIDTGANGKQGKDTLFQIRTTDGEPMAYYRKIRQEACFDGKCRPLDVRIYWNITGRYLGLELPPGEFLSKTEHVPFTRAEYRRLNGLLADSLSPLGQWKIQQIKKTSGEADLDGITGATTPSIAPYVVKGALYTTYVLWHIIYGDTQQTVMRLTAAQLTPNLMAKIVSSNDRGDRLWVLPYLTRANLTPTLQDSLLAMINEENYSLSERVIKLLPANSLNDSLMQNKWIAQLKVVHYALQSLLLEKLMQVTTLYPASSVALAEQMKHLNGKPLADIFKLYRKFQVSDKRVMHVVTELSNSDNGYVAHMAKAYLTNNQ